MSPATKKRTVPKLDLRRQYKDLYLPSAKEPAIVEVPELLFIALDGQIEAGVGPSESVAFTTAIGAMYGVAYGLKFMSKLRENDPIDFTVMALEGLWGSGDGDFEFGSQEPWRFTLLMMQPDHITADMFDQVVAETNSKRPNPDLARVELLRWEEGLAVQMMHVGPYAEEPRTMERLVALTEETGHRPVGRHHEIYIGDPRRAKPENLKTVLRHPIAPL
ncbi:MAG: GyrI-like domain-containing protein [Acidimicrobiia bacterium]|nr:GyrI-like domain-containing protein [Acidimicrobiia bacterium]MDH3464268.1 GyrI-like domain-containing protein [Acidimicrobiia bacterium]